MLVQFSEDKYLSFMLYLLLTLDCNNVFLESSTIKAIYVDRG